MPISYAYTPQEISNFEITRIREESLEVRLNVVMNKFAEEWTKIKGKNPSLWTSSLALDDARIKEMWLNMAWLTPSNGVAPRGALQYEWTGCSVDEEEVCASYIINIPEVTLCQDTHKYILTSFVPMTLLRLLNDYLDSITTSIEPICEPRVAGSKKKSKQKPNNAVGKAPQHYPRVYTQEKGSRPLPRSRTSEKWQVIREFYMFIFDNCSIRMVYFVL